MRVIRTILTTGIILLIFIPACDLNKNRKKVDLGDIEVELEVKRLEQDLLSLDTSSINASLTELASKYDSSFLDIYFSRILNIGSPFASPANAEFLKYFVTSPPITDLNDSVQSKYNNIDKHVEKIEKGLAHFKYYFPKREVPRTLVTFISEFGYGAVTIDTSIMGLGLDLYLGRDYIFYQNYFPAYLSEKFIEERIAVDCISAFYNLYYNKRQESGQALIYKMIEEGKRIVFLEYIMPAEEIHLISGFTEEQWRWCKKNEEMIWKFLIENELLFTTDQVNRRLFIGEGPTTSGMPEESPGNIGPWIGSKVVNACIKNKNIGLKEILNKDSEEIYKLSKYKPSK